MLKGNVQVILYDKNGKEVDRREAHNLVTNATTELQTIVAGGSGGYNVSGKQAMSEIMPLGENGLGGLLLFEDQLTEQASNYDIPANLVLGCADRTANTSNPYRGSLNTDQSGKIQTGYKSTWDFSTTQANGQISAIALTSVQCGGSVAMPPNVQLKKPTNFTDGTNTYTYNNLLPLKYDKTTQYFYFAYPSGQTSSKAKYTIYKVRIPFFSYGVADAADEVGLVETTSYSDIVTNYSSHSYMNFSIDYKQGYAYIQNSSSSGTVTYTRVNLSDFTYTNSSITLENNFIGWCVCDGYAYYTMVGYVKRKNLTTSALKSVELSGITNKHKPVSTPSGNVYLLYSDTSTSTFNSFVVFHPSVVVDDNDMVVRNYGTTKAIVYNTNPIYFGMLQGLPMSSAAMSFYTRGDYLGTIFNLQTAVNKTDATTMKVVYTLTDVTQ